MAKYPSSISSPYTDPVGMGIRFKTLVSNFDNLGEEKRKQKWTYPKRDVTLKYEAISKTEAETLWKFYTARGGRSSAFVWFESTALGSTAYNSYVSEYVGTGDSTTVIFNLPALGSSGIHTLYKAGAAVSTSDYTFAAAGGSNNEDKITFNAAPTSTERITYDFTGRLKVRCRFSEDMFSFENFHDRLINVGVKLSGLLNA